mgnify:FL=1|nr:MAG TPA: hypothetical protein [Caudoviricetes sp.]
MNETLLNAFNILTAENQAKVLNAARNLQAEQQQNIKSFDYHGQEVRTVEMNGQPWFVAADVCNYFGVTNRNRIMQQVDEEDKGGTQMDTPGGRQNVTVINESGLYSLLFAMQPQKARGVTDEYIAARTKQLNAFRRWVTHDVLPSIRKTGGYIAGQETLSPEELMAKALLVAKQTLAERDARINELSCANSELTVQNQILLPRAQYFDELVDRNLLTNFRETAKELGIAPKRFVSWLIEQKYIYRDKKGKLLPYEGKNTGLFELKEQFNPKTEWSGVQTLVTPKGRETFRLLCMGM